MDETTKVCVSILVEKNGKILLGLLTEKWKVEGRQVYGVPGRDIHFKEKIGEAVKRSIKEEINCKTTKYKIFCVNANYEYENHFIGIGVLAEIAGEPKLLKPEDWEKWEWFDKKSIPKNLFPDAKNLIKCFLENKFNVEE